jgi:GTP-binding protein
MPDRPRSVALIGRPNVGKSSLLNRLVGEDRVVVDPEPGTTRDPVDSLVTLGGSVWRFVDTAGLRRRVKTASGTEYYASLRTAQALTNAEVALVLVDASTPLSEQDQRICATVVDAGRALVLALNKWDLVDDVRRADLERELDRDFARYGWAPRVNVSARTGRAVDRLAPALQGALAGWETRVPTGRLNSWLGDIVAATPPPARGGRAPKVLFATQAGVAPPHFALFTTGALEAGYRRFLERRLRADFGFAGSPIAISVRNRGSRQR